AGVRDISFVGPGTGAEPPVLLPIRNRFSSGEVIQFPVSIYNPRGTDQENVSVELTSDWPTAKIIQGKKTISKLSAGEVVNLHRDFQVQFTAGEGSFERASLQLKITYDGWQNSTSKLEVWITPDHLSEPLEVKVLDGRKETFDIFWQQ